jgi:hypothetical protein
MFFLIMSALQLEFSPVTQALNLPANSWKNEQNSVQAFRRMRFAALHIF